MAVVVMGIGMPKKCEWCQFSNGYQVVHGVACGCRLTMKTRPIDRETRPEWCPLVEVEMDLPSQNK